MATNLNELPPFPGIRDEGLQFLEDLSDDAHQDREWFNARKYLYTDELLWPMRCLVADVVRRLENGSPPRLYGDPQRSVFRIYRDVRFSKNKRPYQTHIACRFTVDPDLKEQNGLVYVHIEPSERSFVAAGIYMPSVKKLRPIRNRIVQNPSVWTDVVAELDRHGLAPSSDGDDLKSMPQGFSEYRDHELAPYLRWTSFLVRKDMDLNAVRSSALTDFIVDFAEESWPLLKFVSESEYG